MKPLPPRSSPTTPMSPQRSSSPARTSADKEQSRFTEGEWDWGSNRGDVKTFMAKGVERAGDWDTVYMLGMRGSGHADVRGAGGGHRFEQETLASAFGEELVDIPQGWMLYKEVSGYWQMGMDVEETVTLCWTDDSRGNIHRIPTAAKNERVGGSGMYCREPRVLTPLFPFPHRRLAGLAPAVLVRNRAAPPLRYTPRRGTRPRRTRPLRRGTTGCWMASGTACWSRRTLGMITGRSPRRTHCHLLRRLGRRLREATGCWDPGGGRPRHGRRHDYAPPRGPVPPRRNGHPPAPQPRGAARVFAGHVQVRRRRLHRGEPLQYHPQRSDVCYTTIPSYGRTLAGAKLWPLTTPLQSSTSSPSLVCPLHLLKSPKRKR